jgi:D-beta-D-heptose 7-phosphate kinase/D-beta-D-heptose 1-phosphate adenosyltransferase
MNILVIGDSCIDEYRYGDITRVNPEATVPLLTYEKSEERFGMAQHVYQNLIGLGMNAEFHGPEVLSRKIRYIDRRTGNHLLRVDMDVISVPYVPKQTYDYDAIVISDYNKGFITGEVISEIRNRFSGPIYMDTKKTNLSKFKNIYIKINQRELYESTSMPERDKLIVTYGARGCGYMDVIYPVKAIEVVDVCGAGDVFLAAMVVKHLETGDMNIALPFANDKAALSCQSLGTVCVS